MKEYSLYELSELLQETIETDFAGTYQVRAEIASVSTKGGHLYLDLVEKGAGDRLIAKQRATCWSPLQAMLQAYFEEETGSRLQAGMQVLVEVEVNYHTLYGLSLNIVGIDPRYTLGDLARQRQATIQKLHDEGIFDMQRQLPLPTLIRRIAVVSSDTAAGYGDFCDQLAGSGYRFETTLFPASMQGEQAERSIIRALGAIAEREEDFEAVVIIRGGGATSDLGCFDQYGLCAHCAQFPLPILSGIGHTRDVSILDMVAAVALKTPTAVAAYLVERMDGQIGRIEDLAHRLALSANRQVWVRQQRVEYMQQRMYQSLRQALIGQRHRMELLAQRVETASPERIYRMGYSLTMRDGRVVRSAAEVQAGDRLTTYLQDGQVDSIAE